VEQKITDQREQRLQKLFDDCQKQVLSQIIGPFGLSTAMFEDKNGGNVTTLHNFERTDDDYIATDSDRALHKQSRKEYSLRSGQSMRLILRLRREKRGKTWEKNVQTKSVRGVMNTPEKAFPLMGQSSLAMGTSSVLS
jgi:hypothetical protein